MHAMVKEFRSMNGTPEAFEKRKTGLPLVDV